ncbi:MAG: hypothetical protein P1P84_02650 [Deferrisomatales bacterium]|nr:hypothetical protein [Deferrisomatales bacterium]
MELVPAVEGTSDLTHYALWSAADTDGRPLSIVITPRTLLEAVVGAQVDGTVTVTIATDQPALNVLVDTVPQSVDAEGGVVTLRLTSAVDHAWLIGVNEVARYLPDTIVRVTHAA